MPGLLGVGVKEKMSPFHMTSWSCDLTMVRLSPSLFKNLFIFFFGCGGSSLLQRAFSSFDEQGLLSRCGVWLLVAEHRLLGTRAR